MKKSGCLQILFFALFISAGYAQKGKDGDKIISNYLNNITNTPIDFPVAEPLETAEV